MKRSLRSWLWRVPLDEEVDEELAFHLEMRTRELIAQGWSPDAAREQARARLGDIHRLRHTCIDIGRKRDREMRLTQWLEEVRDDVRFALRQMRRAPGFTVTAVLTLALGVGANSAIFALVDAALLRPLPFPAAERLVIVDEHGPGQGGRSRIELLNLREWREQSRTFDAVAAAWIPGGIGGPTMMVGGTPETVRAQTVTPEFFDVLGIRPIAGRTFVSADDSPDPQVIVMSEGFWRRHFGAESGLVGRQITLDGQPVTVVGIVPASFEYLRPSDIWRLLPLPRSAGTGTDRGQCPVCRLLQVVGRMKPGVSVDAARSDLTLLANTIAERNGVRGPRRITVTPLREALIGHDLRITALLFLVVVGFILLLCCVNVANLVLTRATVRLRELAVRAALGAGRRRVAAQLLTESLVLAGLGALLGAAFGTAILAVAPSILPAGLIPGVIELGVDTRVIAFNVLAALVVGILLGLVPVWQVSRASLVEAMNAESRTASGHGGRLRNLLITAEVAVAFLVLCSGGLLLRTLLVLDGFDPGYHVERSQVVTANVVLPTRYDTPESRQRFYDAARREIAALPGVRNVAWATTLPLGGSILGAQSFDIVGQPPAPIEDRPQADYQIVSWTYFDTLDLPVVAGRPFTERDTASAAPVCVVNEAFVRRYLSGANPIGARISIKPLTGPAVEREIVGVARQVKGRPEETEALVQLYVPQDQQPWVESSLVVRSTSGEATQLVPGIRQAVARVDRQLPLNSIETLDDIAGNATARPRFRTVLVMAFAVLALLLAMVGVYGVQAYSVEQRTREFGTRIALGARRSDVLRLVFSGTTRIVIAGVTIGLVATAVAGSVLKAFLFNVQPHDPLTFLAVAGLLVAAAVGAAAVPAWRATRIDPAVAFRID